MVDYDDLVDVLWEGVGWVGRYEGVGFFDEEKLKRVDWVDDEELEKVGWVDDEELEEVGWVEDVSECLVG